MSIHSTVPSVVRGIDSNEPAPEDIGLPLGCSTGKVRRLSAGMKDLIKVTLHPGSMALPPHLMKKLSMSQGWRNEIDGGNCASFSANVKSSI